MPDTKDIELIIEKNVGSSQVSSIDILEDYIAISQSEFNNGFGRITIFDSTDFS